MASNPLQCCRRWWLGWTTFSRICGGWGWTPPSHPWISTTLPQGCIVSLNSSQGRQWPASQGLVNGVGGLRCFEIRGFVRPGTSLEVDNAALPSKAPSLYTDEYVLCVEQYLKCVCISMLKPFSERRGAYSCQLRFRPVHGWPFARREESGRIMLNRQEYLSFRTFQYLPSCNLLSL